MNRYLLSLILFLVTAAPVWAQDAKDLFYEEMKAPKEESFGVAYCLELRRPGMKPFLCNNRYSFKSGDGVRLHIKTNGDRYCYILLKQGSSGKKDFLLYPPNAQEDNRLLAGKEYTVPQSGMLTFDNTQGREQLCIILTKEPIQAEKAMSQIAGVQIDSNLLSGTPQEISGYKVRSNDGAFSLKASENGAPGHGLVFVVNPKGGGNEPTAIGIALDHGGNGTEGPPQLPQTGANEPAASTIVTAVPANQQSGSNRPITDKWAFIVGVNKFKLGCNLQFCVPDAEMFKEFLVKEAGFAPNHILYLADENATTGNIMNVLTQLLPPGVGKDDLVLVYISSHGTPTTNTENFIVTHDYDGQANPGIRMQTLGETIKKHIRSDRVVTILDTCYSGNAREELDTGEYLDEQVSGCGQIVVSSCSMNEKSFEDPGLQHGIFTYYLTEAMRQKRALKASFDACREKVTKAAAKMSGSQNPVVKYDRWQGNDVVLFAKPTQPR